MAYVIGLSIGIFFGVGMWTRIIQWLGRKCALEMGVNIHLSYVCVFFGYVAYLASQNTRASAFGMLFILPIGLCYWLSRDLRKMKGRAVDSKVTQIANKPKVI